MPTPEPGTTPVIRGLATLFSEPLPREQPLLVHLTHADWTKLSKGISVSRRKISVDATGLLITPDGFGGHFAAFACAMGSKDGLACIPEVVGGLTEPLTLGTGCRCIRGKDKPDT